MRTVHLALQRSLEVLTKADSLEWRKQKLGWSGVQERMEVETEEPSLSRNCAEKNRKTEVAVDMGSRQRCFECGRNSGMFYSNGNNPQREIDMTGTQETTAGAMILSRREGMGTSTQVLGTELQKITDSLSLGKAEYIVIETIPRIPG